MVHSLHGPYLTLTSRGSFGKLGGSRLLAEGGGSSGSDADAAPASEATADTVMSDASSAFSVSLLLCAILLGRGIPGSNQLPENILQTHWNLES